MRKLLILTVSAAALAGIGFSFASVMAADALAVDLAMVPVFPIDDPKTVATIEAPQHATNRVSSNGKSFRFVACRESRDVRGTQERRCLSWNPKKGWSKSPKWLPAYQLLPLR